MKTLYNKLSDYGNSDYYGFHMPGHKRQYNMLGAELPYKMDITEIDGFDDLHHAKGILKEAQERAAKVYHAEETCYLINGSTSGILSAVLGCTNKGGGILMARNCHKSVYAAVYMNELKAEYIYPEYDRKTGLNGPVNVEEIRKILGENVRNPRGNKIQAVVITSPTYDGVLSDVRAIAEAVHKFGIPLIVDEAHGAHFGFHPYFPENANDCGADVVIHSLHKTLPALTQTALIHMNGKLADRERIKKYLHMVQTSSPSYILMASMERCIGLLEEKPQLFDNYVDMLGKTREKLSGMKCLKLVETEHYDPSKIVISTEGTGYTGKQLYEELLKEYHLQMEMAAKSYIIAMTSVGDVQEGFDRLEQALFEIDGKLEARRSGMKSQESESGTEGLPRLEQVCTSAQADNQQEKAVSVEWEECEGMVSAEYAYVYPPGIPMIVPGERISKEAVQKLCEYDTMGFDIEGLCEYGKIKVFPNI